jgi:hypothetical protein
MKAVNVPQDDANILEGKLKVIKYATDKAGNYRTVKTVGWEAENTVLLQAWDEINSKIESAKQKVLENRISPIAYFMEKNMFSIKLLSQYMNQWTFTTKRHLKPGNFKKLSDKKLKKYADVFQISVEELINFNS